jgi:hypothetical protein
VTGAGRAQRVGQEVAIVMTAILQQAAPNNYSGQWLCCLPGKPASNPGSIDHNGRAGRLHFRRLPPNACKTTENRRLIFFCRK